MSTTLNLNLEPRQDSGKGVARKLRGAGRVPGVVYGKGLDPVKVSMDRHTFLTMISGHAISNAVLDLDIAGDTAKALIREVQVDPLTQELLHVDFNRVSLTKKLEIEVPVELVGVPDGVKTHGGILSQPIRTVTVLCLPTEVPTKIEVDVSQLGIGQIIHVSDIKVPGSELVGDPDLVLAGVTAPSVAAEPETEAEGEEAEAVAGEEADGEEKKEDEAKKEDGDK